MLESIFSSWNDLTITYPLSRCSGNGGHSINWLVPGVFGVGDKILRCRRFGFESYFSLLSGAEFNGQIWVERLGRSWVEAFSRMDKGRRIGGLNLRLGFRQESGFDKGTPVKEVKGGCDGRCRSRLTPGRLYKQIDRQQCNAIGRSRRHESQ